MWTKGDLPYVLNSLVVDSGGTLVLRDNPILKFEDGGIIFVAGTLIGEAGGGTTINPSLHYYS